MTSSPTIDILRGELERHFELDDLHAMCRDLLGIDPASISGGSGKGAFVRQLVDRCVAEDSVEALTDALLSLRPLADARVREIFARGVEEHDLAEGTIVGAYRVLRRIGEGGVGTVYLAEPLSVEGTATTGGAAGAHVAVKVLHQELCRDRRAVRRLLTAARVVKSIKHPGVVAIHAVGELPDGRPWVAMEHLEGGQTLAARIQRQGPMHFSEARTLVRGILDAVEAIHERDLLHGDIKTENVFLVRGPDDALRVVLLGIGTDKLRGRPSQAAERTGNFGVFGTAKVLAPELLRGEASDRRADIYSVGALLYELVTGRPPFAGHVAIDALIGHLTREPEPPSHHAPRGWVTRDIDAVILKALKKAPSERQQSIAELRSDLEKIGRAAAVAATAEPVSKEKLEEIAAALKESPSDETRAVALEEAALSAGDWTLAVEAMQAAADALPAEAKDTKLGLLFRVARILETEMKAHEKAELAYNKILDIDEANEIALVGIEDLKRTQGRHEELVEMLLERVEREHDPRERSRVLRDIASLYENELSDPQKAFFVLSRALGELPGDDALARDVERIADRTGLWEDLMRTLAEFAARAQEGPEEMHLLVRMGRWYGEKIGKNDAALPCLQRALRIDPASDAPVDAMASYYRRTNMHAELAALLMRRAESSTNPARSRESLVEAAQMYEERLNESGRAQELYARVVKDDPGHPQAVTALERMYEKAGRWSDLVKILERRAEATSGKERAAALRAAAELHEDRLNDAEAATRAYRGLLDGDKTNVDALKGLERVYAKAGKYRDLLGVLDAQLALAESPRQKITLNERMGALYAEEFKDHAQAAATYEALLAVDPSHLGAIAALEKLYRLLGRWEDLQRTLGAHAKLTENRGERLDLSFAQARAIDESIKDPERAVAAYRAVLEIEAAHGPSLEALAVLAEARGDLDGAVEVLEKLAPHTVSPSARAQLFVRAGRILERKGDAPAASERYRRALDADPGCTEASSALQSSYAEKGDYASAAEMLELQADVAEGALGKSKLLVEAGRVYHDKLGNLDKAAALFRRALQLDPQSLAAVSPLAEILYTQKHWEEAVRLYEWGTARVNQLPKDEQVRLYSRLGEMLMSLGRKEDALKAYQNARGAVPEDRSMLERSAAVAYEAGTWGEARALYAELMSRYGGELKGDERVQILFRLGDSKLKAGEIDGAERPLVEAAEADPTNDKALAALGEVYRRLEKWPEAVRVLGRRMERLTESERHGLLVETGDLLREKVADAAGAAKAYQQALALSPDDRNVLARLMQLFSDQKQWAELLDVLVRIAGLVSEPMQQGKYYAAAAGLCYQELNLPDKAVEYYELALDRDVTSHLRGFDVIVEVLTAKQDWQGLERALRRMIGRLPDKGGSPEQQAARARFWGHLAEVCHHRLSFIPQAIEAYEEAHAHDPEDRRRIEVLAELYETDPKRFAAKAIKLHAQILRRSPYRIDSYKALRRLYTERKKADESWCICQALTVLNMAEPDEEQFYRKGRTKTAAPAVDRMTESDWVKLLIHGDEDPRLSSLFNLMMPAIGAARSEPLKALGVDKKDKIDIARAESPVGRALYYAAEVLDLDAPDVFVKSQPKAGLLYLHTNPPSIGFGGALEGLDPQTLAFLVGRHLTYYRGGHAIRRFVPTGTGLRAWLFGAIRLVRPKMPVAEDLERPVRENLAALEKHLAGPAIEQVQSLVSKLIEEAGRLDLKRWAAAVDYTADRAGFLLANDLEIAAAAIRAAGDEENAPPAKDRTRELILFAVSEEYFDLRHRLGIALQALVREETSPPPPPSKKPDGSKAPQSADASAGSGRSGEGGGQEGANGPDPKDGAAGGTPSGPEGKDGKDVGKAEPPSGTTTAGSARSG